MPFTNNELLNLRVDNNFTYDDIAKYIGCTASLVMDVEMGIFNAPVSYLMDFMRIFDFSATNDKI